VAATVSVTGGLNISNYQCLAPLTPYGCFGFLTLYVRVHCATATSILVFGNIDELSVISDYCFIIRGQSQPDLDP
jgi:hypothetical protein